ncbi:MAG: ABC transporter ATP-binding protein [Sporomusaceae bacterium]|nr:ABC transporter ATP-binding protein [Sporomusaceae bacterium]
MLIAQNVTVQFGAKLLFQDLSLTIQEGTIVSIIGPNGSGKSTFLKTLSRALKPQQGKILLDGKELYAVSAAELARTMAVLPQTPSAPNDLTVRDLISYGRFPHQRWWKNTQKEDASFIEWAIETTQLTKLADRIVATLSGGERQRVWLAMALAQKPRLLLLDEPTTYLDISHQLEILELIARLNREEKITVIMVLHDMNHAARYSDQIAVLSSGALYSAGSPADVITKQMLREVFRIEADIWLDETGRPLSLARSLAKGNEETL